MKLLVVVPDHLGLDYEKLLAVLGFVTEENVGFKLRRMMPRCKVLADISISPKNARKAALIAQDFGLEIPGYTWRKIGVFPLEKHEAFQYSDR